MQSIPQRVTLVEFDGSTLPVTERADSPEPDPTDPSNWPAWTDNWFWELADLAEVAELEREAAEAMADAADAPRASSGESLWLQLLLEGSISPIRGGAPFEPSPEDWVEPSPKDWEDYARAFDRTDGLSFPRPMTAADRRAFQADIVEHYRSHPES